ncbi:MAG: molecular chaperone TorD family protein [Gammaproteobacteria bacterium]|nr:MAG: molecular chaperone TorD family protein [Gammaproteobacteria bacterium]
MSAVAMKDEQAGKVEMATARSQAYGLLASVFRAEPSREFIDELRGPRFAGALASLDVDLGRDFEIASAEALREDLGIEFTRLFMGPGEHISPHESIFVEVDGEAGGLYGAITVKVKKFIETTGLVYDDAFTGLPDHVSVELEFMGRLSEFEAEKWADGDDEGARYCLSVQKMFAEEHLLRWIPQFCEQVIARADLPFYREMARITNEFVDFDYESIEKSLA